MENELLTLSLLQSMRMAPQAAAGQAWEAEAHHLQQGQQAATALQQCCCQLPRLQLATQQRKQRRAQAAWGEAARQVAAGQAWEAEAHHLQQGQQAATATALQLCCCQLPRLELATQQRKQRRAQAAWGEAARQVAAGQAWEAEAHHLQQEQQAATALQLCCCQLPRLELATQQRKQRRAQAAWAEAARQVAAGQAWEAEAHHLQQGQQAATALLQQCCCQQPRLQLATEQQKLRRAQAAWAEAARQVAAGQAWEAAAMETKGLQPEALELLVHQGLVGAAHPAWVGEALLPAWAASVAQEAVTGQQLPHLKNHRKLALMEPVALVVHPLASGAEGVAASAAVEQPSYRDVLRIRAAVLQRA